jgi:hypothetical protein
MEEESFKNYLEQENETEDLEEEEQNKFKLLEKRKP